MNQDFDSIADTFDRWYDTPDGKAIFKAERDCLFLLCEGPFDSWLEVGVGTGRFALALGISTGVDSSRGMLAIAGKRGIETVLGEAGGLPFTHASFDGALMVLTLCFVDDGLRSLVECRRVLRPGGHLLLGIVPADSGWGRAYREKAAQGHPFYSHARFRTAAEVMELAQSAGFSQIDSASTLFWSPGEEPEPVSRIEKGATPEAGFLALHFHAS